MAMVAVLKGKRLTLLASVRSFGSSKKRHRVPRATGIIRSLATAENCAIRHMLVSISCKFCLRRGECLNGMCRALAPHQWLSWRSVFGIRGARV